MEIIRSLLQTYRNPEEVQDGRCFLNARIFRSGYRCFGIAHLKKAPINCIIVVIFFYHTVASSWQQWVPGFDMFFYTHLQGSPDDYCNHSAFVIFTALTCQIAW